MGGYSWLDVKGLIVQTKLRASAILVQSNQGLNGSVSNPNRSYLTIPSINMRERVLLLLGWGVHHPIFFEMLIEIVDCSSSTLMYYIELLINYKNNLTGMLSKCSLTIGNM